MENIFTNNEGNVPDPLITEFLRIKSCPEREQLRIIDALNKNGIIDVEWIDDGVANITIKKNSYKINKFLINKKIKLF